MMNVPVEERFKGGNTEALRPLEGGPRGDRHMTDRCVIGRRVRHVAVAGICALVLTGMLVSPADAFTGTFHNHNGWVKYTILEQFNVTATETYVEMGYWQDVNRRFPGSTEVGGVVYDNKRCSTSRFPFWTIKDCYEYTTDGYPYTEQIDMIGHFHNLGIDYQQHSSFKALSDNRYEQSCYLDHGALPILWSQDCQSGRS